MLKQRAAESGPAIQMSDALSWNAPKLPDGVELLVAHCLAHGRRQIVEVAQNFPVECRHVLERLGEVYRNDAGARDAKMTAEERLRFHQQHSRPIMEALHEWLEAQFGDRKVEPNSSLGKAITYLLRHWKALTLFLREAGAPLDNNIVTAARRSDRVQCRLIIQHFRHRHLSFDYLLFAARVHALDAAAARVEVAHDVATAFLWRSNLHVHDWLKQCRPDFLHGVAKCFATGGAEAVLVRIDVVIRAVN